MLFIRCAAICFLKFGFYWKLMDIRPKRHSLSPSARRLSSYAEANVLCLLLWMPKPKPLLLQERFEDPGTSLHPLPSMSWRFHTLIWRQMATIYRGIWIRFHYLQTQLHLFYLIRAQKYSESFCLHEKLE